MGRKWYRRESDSAAWRIADLPEGMPHPLLAEASLESPYEDVVWLPDEVIDGVDTWHYRRTVDLLEKLIATMEAETDPAEKEMLQALLDSLTDAEMTLEMEVWIGKDDFLFRIISADAAVKAPHEA